MTSIPFIKMHGLGNDFVIFNSEDLPAGKTFLDIAALADRRRGVGCDQVILLAQSDTADIAMRIFNADGQEVGACGNATRCVGWLLLQENNVTEVTISTPAGLLTCKRTKDALLVTANMGVPRLEWQEIPLAREQDTLRIELEAGALSLPVAVNMGNPHAVFFVEDVDAVELERVGPELEHHPIFPEGANISVAEVVSRTHLKMRVWERGVGLTSACGTAACAAVVAAVRRELTGRSVLVELPGGELEVNWRAEAQGNEVWMTGAVAVSFQGTFEVEEYGR